MADTIKVKRDGPRGWHNIAAASFDPAKHELYDAPAKQTVQGTPEELGTDSGDQFSDEQLRDIIKDATGKAPHHKTGREKLVATFNELNAA